MRYLLIIVFLFYATNTSAGWVDDVGILERPTSPSAKPNMGIVWIDKLTKDLMFIDSDGLQYNILLGGGIGGAKLNDLSDVDTFTASPTVGQTIVFDGSIWKPGSVASTLAALSDVTTATLTDGNPLVYSNSLNGWKNLDTVQLGTVDPFGRTQIWNYSSNASLRLGSLGQDGDPTDVSSEGSVFYGADPQSGTMSSALGNFGYARIKSDRFGLYKSTSNNAGYYFRADSSGLYYTDNSYAKTFEIDRLTGGIKFSGVHTQLEQSSSPSGVANYGQVYPKTDKKLYYMDSSGSEKEIVTGTGGKTLIGSSSIVITQDATTATFTFSGINTDDLLDVDAATPSEGNTLVYNSSTSKWVASAPQVAAGSAQWIYPFTASSTTNSAYLKMDYQPQDIGENTYTVAVTNAAPVLIRKWIYDADYADTSIPAGEWTYNFFGSVDSAVGNTYFTVTIFARSSTGTETDLFTDTFTDVNSTSVIEQVKKVIHPSYSVSSTDRIGVKVYANTDAVTSKNLTLYIGNGTHYSRFSGPFIPRHNNLRALYGDADYYHLSQAKYNAVQNLTASGTQTNFTGDVQSASCVYYGNSTSDDSFQTCATGGSLVVKKRTNGVWTEVFRMDNF